MILFVLANEPDNFDEIKIKFKNDVVVCDYSNFANVTFLDAFKFYSHIILVPSAINISSKELITIIMFVKGLRFSRAVIKIWNGLEDNTYSFILPTAAFFMLAHSHKIFRDATEDVTLSNKIEWICEQANFEFLSWDGLAL